MNKIVATTLGLIAISFLFGIYFYNQMPDEMASHWDFQGNVNGYMPKAFGLFLMPVISLGMLLLFIYIPKIDPLKQNIRKFRKYYDGFILVLIAFLFYLDVLFIVWNLGFMFNLAQMLAPAFGILIYYIGILTENAERNWFIGIRTPWTLSDDRVWKSTHKIGGKLLKASGIISFFGVLLPKYGILFVLAPVIAVVVYAFFYSYFKYQKIVKKK